MFPHRRHRKASPDPAPVGSPPGSPSVSRGSISGRGEQQHQQPSGGSDGSSGDGTGFYSYFATAARRRWGKVVKSDNDTLLPTTFNKKQRTSSVVGGSSSSSAHMSFNPTAKSCNNFLMGGHYYPGKDKKRRMMRRKTLWYRIFCASTFRKGCSFLFGAYIVVYYGLVPLGNWLLDVGQSLSSSQGGIGIGKSSSSSSSSKNNWLQYDSTLMIPTIKAETSYREKIISFRTQLDQLQTYQQHFVGGGGSSTQAQNKKLSILEGIAPNWFHRNDYLPPSSAKDSAKTKTTHGNNEKNDNNNQDGGTGAGGIGHQHKKRKKSFHQQRSHNVDNDNNANTTTTTKQQLNKDNNDEKTNNVGQPQLLPKIRFNTNNSTANTIQSRRRLLQVKGDDFTIERDLHNMDDLASSQSSCHPSPLTTTTTNQQKWETTLVIQTSLNRLWILNETCQRWKDPIVAVVFIKKQQQQQDGATDADHAAAALTMTQIISSCPNVNIIQYEATHAESTITKNYPVNKLRNIGLDAVTTSHVLVIDIDFVPSQNLHLTIRDALQQRHNNTLNLQSKDGGSVGGSDEYDLSNNKQALIVPAFERKPPKPCESADQCSKYLQSNSSFIPQTFSDLQHCYLNTSCVVFQSEVNWEGHYSTRSEEWLLQKKWYEKEDDDNNNNHHKRFRSLPCFHTARYEPYVVLRWCPDTTTLSSSLSEGEAEAAKAEVNRSNNNNNNNIQKPVAPYYDERFHGYGKNKIELVSHLRKSGYRFAILPEGFIVHNPHPESQIKETWNDRSNSDLHASMDQLYTVFLNELDTKYRDIHNITIKLCRHQ